MGRIICSGSPQKWQSLTPDSERCWQARSQGRGRKLPLGDVSGTAAPGQPGQGRPGQGKVVLPHQRGETVGKVHPPCSWATLHLHESPARIFSDQFPFTTGTCWAEKRIISNSMYEKYSADSSLLDSFPNSIYESSWQVLLCLTPFLAKNAVVEI